MVAAEEANSDEEAITATLTVWGPSEDQAEENGQWLQTMCDQFNEAHPNWDLTFEYGVCPEGEAKATVTQDVEGAADVYMFANDNLPDLVSSNAISRLGGDTEAAIKETNSQEIVDSVSILIKVIFLAVDPFGFVCHIALFVRINIANQVL